MTDPTEVDRLDAAVAEAKVTYCLATDALTVEAGHVLSEQLASSPYGPVDTPNRRDAVRLAASYRAAEAVLSAAQRARNAYRRAVRDRERASAMAEYHAAQPPYVPRRTEQVVPLAGGRVQQ